MENIFENNLQKMNSEPEENKESTGKYQIDLIDGEEDNNELSLLNDTDLDEEEK